MRTMPDQAPPVPPLIYGTAWKEDRTAALTRLALDAGFLGIDTANQRRHYVEAAVGEALRPAERARLFLQTKYTSVDGQDHRLPYDPDAPPAVQVGQSLAASLEHLRTDYVDALLLHGPSRPDRFTREDLEAWRAMAAEQGAGRARRIGVSNVAVAHLRQLEAGGEPLPAIVQNRCFARSGWDHEVRAFCRDRGIVYQAFSLLTANGRELAAPAVSRIARRLGRTVPQVVFRFAMQAGMIPLTGTTDPLHMREDLACLEFSLPDEDVETLAGLGTGGAPPRRP